MKDQDNLPDLLREYLDNLRAASPSLEFEARLKEAMRQPRPAGRVVAFPRWLAAAAAIVVVGSVGWWWQRPAAPAPAVPAARVELAEARPPSVAPEPQPPAPAPPRARQRAAAPEERSAPPLATAANTVERQVERQEAASAPAAVPAAPAPGRIAEAAPKAAAEPVAAPASVTADAVAPAPGVTYRVRREVRAPGQNVVTTILTRGAAPPLVLGFTAPAAKREAKAEERMILGYRCQLTRREENGATIERWRSAELGVDLLVRTTTPDGAETIEEVIEVIRRP